MAARAVPQIETDPTPVIAELLHTTVVRSELVSDRPSHALRRVELADGRIVGIKHYALGRSYAIEGAALRELAGAVPVPEIVYTLDRVIAYRWIEGIPLESCLRGDASRLAALAAPLGAFLGTLAGIPRPARPVGLGPVRAQLAAGRARARLGDALADGLLRRLDAEPSDLPACFVHGDLDARQVIVAPTLDRIAGVVGWQASAAGSMLIDAGRLFRHPARYDAAFRAAFERGHGRLPADWLRRARLVDAARLVEVLAGEPDPPAGSAELHDVIAGVVAPGAA